MPLADNDPELAAALLGRYGRRWLELANLPQDRLPEVPDTVELLVAPDWTEPPDEGLRILRLRSWYTGSTYWFPEWDGSVADAERWIDEIADLQAGNVVDERAYGPTEWDDPTEWNAPVMPTRPPGFHGIVEVGDPGESSVQLIAHFEFSREPGVDDVALAVERLGHSPEISSDLAAEARTRAAQEPSPRSFFEWLANKLRDRVPHPEPIDCDCGAALLDPSEFSGSAIVRCGLCGARWGIEVQDADSWSQWSLDASGEEAP